jgi:hypothetical protein
MACNASYPDTVLYPRIGGVTICGVKPRHSPLSAAVLVASQRRFCFPKLRQRHKFASRPVELRRGGWSC